MKSFVYELDSARSLVRKEVVLSEDSLPPGAVLAETQFTAISPGTECAAWLGKPPLRPTSNVYPRLVGYCNLAKVIAVGDEVFHSSEGKGERGDRTQVKKGDLILTHQSHRSAFICDASEVLLRVESIDVGLLKKLTATYLYHLGFHALQQGDYRPGHQVAVIGVGTLGFTTASLLCAFGGAPLLFTQQANSLKESRALRRAHFFSKTSFDILQVKAICGMEGVDLVINTSNAWSDFLLGLKLCRKGATMVCLGFPGRGESLPEFNPLDSQYFYDKQLTFKHCGYTPDLETPPIDIRFTKKRNMKYLAALIKDGVLDPTEILSLNLSWSELSRAYELLCRRESGNYSALIEWCL